MNDPGRQDAPPSTLAGAAFAVASAASLGSVWLSVGLGLKACPLCFYQRSFMMGTAAVLGLGLLAARAQARLVGLLASPLAVAGFGVAAFHVVLELTGKLECPRGLLGLGSAPQQSLAASALLLGIFLAVALRSWRDADPAWRKAAVASVVVGAAIAFGSIVSAPPLPPAPTKAHAGPFEMCRPPFEPGR